MSERESATRLEVDAETCIGAGQCVAVAAEVFDQDDDEGTVILLDETPPEGLRDAVEEAIGLCPVAAIRRVAGA